MVKNAGIPISRRRTACITSMVTPFQ